jgi:hypothetical protein
MRIEDFHQLHRGETCLIVGVGPNLKLTPPEWFDYPSFGVNTIYKQTDWRPTYYVGVDERLRVEDGEAIVKTYADIPKFFPRPDFDSLKGENIYRFLKRPGDLYVGGQLANHRDALTKNGIGYRRIMDAVLQIAWHMGFTTMLMIGIQHKPGATREHFWGLDERAIEQPQDFWFDGYRYFAHAMGDTRVLNISEDTYVPEEVLPRSDWHEWAVA